MTSIASDTALPATAQPETGDGPVTVGPVQFMPFLGYATMLATLPFFLWKFAPSFFAASATLVALIQSWRLACLEGEPQAVEKARGVAIADLCISAVGAGGLWVADRSLDIGFVHGLTLVLIGVLAALMVFGQTAERMAAGRMAAVSAKPAAPPPTPTISVPLDELAARRARMAADAKRLAATRLSSRARSAQLKQAWERNDNDRIEALLRQADAQVRQALDQAGRTYNQAAGDIDLARKNLKARLAETEVLLRQYAIDYAAIEPPKSKSLEIASRAFERRKLACEQLNMGGFGTGIAKVVSGNTPWQVAALATVTVVAWHLIARSRARRQLKEAESQIAANTKAARGDLKLLAALLTTRLIPQLDQLIDVTVRLETATGALREFSIATVAEAAAEREAALRLAFVLVEGNRLLEIMAGD